MATERLDIIVRLNDASKAGTKQVKKNVSEIGVAAGAASKSVKALGASLLGITAIFAAGRGFANAVNTFKEFDDVMRQAGAVTNATAEEMEDLTAIAKEMGKTTRFTSTQAAEGLRFLGLAGFEAAESIEALPGVLQLAAAGSLELGRAADIATNILSAYGFEVSELGRVNDTLVKTFTSSNNSLQEIGEAFKLVGPIAKGLGAEFEDLLAAIGKLGDAGIKASIGGTSLRGTLSALFNPTKQEAILMESLTERLGGVSLQIQKTNGDFIGFAEVVEQLERASITGGEAMALFGLRAGPGMQALVNQGSDSLFKLREEIRKSSGVASEIAEKMEAGIGGAIRRLNAASESLKLTLIDTFGGEVTRAIDGTKESILGLSEAIEDLAAPLTLVSGVFSEFFSKVGKAIKVTFEFVIVTITQIGKLIALFPFLLTTVQENVEENTKVTVDALNEIALRFQKLFDKFGLVEMKIDLSLDADFAAITEELDAGLLFAVKNMDWDAINKEFDRGFDFSVFDPATLETKLKAGLVKLSAILDKESTILENEFTNGIIELDQYFEEREIITRRQLAKEIQLLKQKLQTEKDLNKKELIGAAIFAKEQQLQTELIKLEQEKLKEFQKLEKQKNSELDANLQKRLKIEQKAADADRLLNNLKIKNSIITSTKLEQIQKNELIKFNQTQQKELERFEKKTKDELKLLDFRNEQILEKDKFLAQQRINADKILNEAKIQSDKILNDIRFRNAQSTSTSLEALQANELAKLDQRQQEELARFTKFVQDQVDAEQQIKDLAREQELEKDKVLASQQKRLFEFRLQFAADVFDGLAQISNDLFELSGRQSKELFAIAQASAIATAIMNTAVGVTKALAQGGIFGIITGAIVAAAGAVQIATIASQSFADGGIIQGHSPHSRADNIPINATAGEGVVNVPGMQRIGPDALNLINKQAPMDQIISAMSNKGKMANFSIPKASSGRLSFADGGQIPRQVQPSFAGTGTGAVQPFNIINVPDSSFITQYLSTNEGKNAVINVIGAKAKVVRNKLGI